MEHKTPAKGEQTSLEVVGPVQEIEPRVLSAVEMKQQVQAIQQTMEAVMISGVHYGVIPGTSKKDRDGKELTKPSLLKPGAEKIMMTFRLGCDPEVLDLSSANEARFRIKVKIFSILNGCLVGYGIGEASSNETKYKWRAAFGTEFEEAEPTRRRVKHYKDGGSTKQVRQEIADVSNTVLKMAKKRALVDGVLTATAASDVFDQDLEDLEVIPETGNEDAPPSGKPHVAQPKAKEEAAPAKQASSGPTDLEMIEQVKRQLNEMGEPADGARRLKANEIMATGGISKVVDYVQAEFETWKKSGATKPATT
jgi:hypothetical protein